MMDDKQITDVLAQFELAGEVTSVEPWGDGHINRTYKVHAGDLNYVLQRINETVFRDIAGLMHNVEAVTRFLRARGRETLDLVPTTEGRTYLETNHGTYRMYLFIEDSTSYSVMSDPRLAEAAGMAFGSFQNELSAFDASTLNETIPYFHFTPRRVDNLVSAIAAGNTARVENARPEIDAYLDESGYSTVTDMLAAGEIPLRVTHNDTKINNVLFDTETGLARAVIDLDTVMPGSLLYDFGDALRTGAATTAEDDPDPSNMALSLELFTAYCRGFLGAVHDSITPAEVDLLVFSVKLMTLECGIRFLTDYLEGDHYFATEYPEHNLVRARTQLALARDIERKKETMNDIVLATLEGAIHDR